MPAASQEAKYLYTVDHGGKSAGSDLHLVPLSTR